MIGPATKSETAEAFAPSRARQEAMYGFPYHHIMEFDSSNYSGFAQTKNSPSGFRYASYLIRTIEELEGLEFDSLIDIGCGDGFFLKHVADRFRDKQLVGIDISEPAIQLANTLCNPGTQGVGSLEYHCDDVVNNPPTRQFDVGTSIAVLEHIPPEDLADFVAAHRRAIKPGGTLLVVLPSKNLPIKNISRHYQHFDDDSARAMLEPNFTVESIEYLNNDRFWGRLLSVILTNRMFILNHRGLREFLFKQYMKRMVRCRGKNGFMMIVRCRRPMD